MDKNVLRDAKSYTDFALSVLRQQFPDFDESGVLRATEFCAASFARIERDGYDGICERWHPRGFGGRGEGLRLDGCEARVASADGGGESVVGCNVGDSERGRSSSVGSCGSSGGPDVVVRGKNYVRNRAKRDKARARVSAGREQRVADKLGSANWRASASPSVTGEGGGARGYFAGCSDEVRRSLRDTRAAMLVSQNKMRAAEAEHKCRQTQARVEARLVEEEVEKKRLDLALALEVARKRVNDQLPVGFAETVVSEGLVSVIGTPSLSDGSVSPSSSISVSELKRKDDAIRSLVAKVALLEGKRTKDTKGDVQEPEIVRDASVASGSPAASRFDDECVRAARDAVFGPASFSAQREVVGGAGYSQWDVPVGVGSKPSAADDAAMLARCKEENDTAELIAPGTVISRF